MCFVSPIIITISYCKPGEGITEKGEHFKTSEKDLGKWKKYCHKLASQEADADQKF